PARGGPPSRSGPRRRNVPTGRSRGLSGKSLPFALDAHGQKCEVVGRAGSFIRLPDDLGRIVPAVFRGIKVKELVACRLRDIGRTGMERVILDHGQPAGL